MATMTPKGKSQKTRITNHRNQFGRLAMLYYPERPYSRAVHLFRRELEQTAGLMEALKGVGFYENQRVLTTRQVRVIEHFLGKP